MSKLIINFTWGFFAHYGLIPKISPPLEQKDERGHLNRNLFQFTFCSTNHMAIQDFADIGYDTLRKEEVSLLTDCKNSPRVIREM